MVSAIDEIIYVFADYIFNGIDANTKVVARLHILARKMTHTLEGFAPWSSD